jgi:predicted GIY-YIG superfamily endonuclease
MRKIPGYWNKENCKKEALKYKSRLEFRKRACGAYDSSLRNHWIDEVCYHMNTNKRNPKGHWTKERCIKAALKCDSRNEFHKKYPGAYNNCFVKKWLDEVCSHMRSVMPNGYWTKDRCYKEALKYKYRNEFSQKSASAYACASSRGWLSDICNHMSYKGSYMRRNIYAFEFENKIVYVGLTCDIPKRKGEHLTDNKSSVKKFIDTTGSKFEFKVLTGFLTEEEASNQEKKFIIKYKKEGWRLLNKSSGGTLGSGTKKWTKNRCQNEALKYKSRSEFQKKCSGAYKSSKRNNWIDEVCSHMITVQLPHGYWTKQKCIDKALEYKSRNEFQRENKGAYFAAWKNKWLKEMFAHIK